LKFFIIIYLYIKTTRILDIFILHLLSSICLCLAIQTSWWHWLIESLPRNEWLSIGLLWLSVTWSRRGCSCVLKWLLLLLSLVLIYILIGELSHGRRDWLSTIPHLRNSCLLLHRITIGLRILIICRLISRGLCRYIFLICL
jgi:hypothetical protein